MNQFDQLVENAELISLDKKEVFVPEKKQVPCTSF